MNTKLKIEKGTVQETLVMPLYARKIANQLYPFYYNDPMVEEIISRLDYDFSNIEAKKDSFSYQFGALEAAMRYYDFKLEIEDFLSEHPSGSIINMGCGLDVIGEITDNGERTLYNIDYPDIINLRNALIASDDRTHNIPSDLNDLSWLDEIEENEECLFIASGVFYYFEYEQVKALILAIVDQFDESRIIFDVAGKTATKIVNKSFLKISGMGKDVKAKFSLSDPEKQLEDWSPALTISVKGYMCGYASVDLDTRIEWSFRKLAKFADNNMKMKIVRLDF